MQQYFAAKETVPDAILLFRMGDFYEMFFEDAQQVSEICDLTLTQRGTHGGDPIPMAGVPVSQKENYVRRILEAGERVAICEQVEAASASKGIVRREITEVFSPGVRLDSDSLERDRPNYLVAISSDIQGSIYGLAALDISTGDFRGTQAEGNVLLIDELKRLDPTEVICDPLDEEFLTLLGEQLPEITYGPARSSKAENEFLELPTDDDLPHALQGAVRLLTGHLQAMHLTRLDHIRPLERYSPGNHLILDATTLQNLELFRTTDGSTGKGTLFQLIQRACSGPGSRALRAWMRRPLKDCNAIQNRQDAIAWLLDEPEIQEDLRESLSQVRDIERIMARVVSESANPRDLANLQTSVSVLPGITTLIEKADGTWLQRLLEQLDPLTDISETLRDALTENPPVQRTDGNIIRSSFDPTIAELRELKTDGAKWFIDYEQGERDRTDIPSLKVRYNKVFGYYIEVTRTHLSKVPEDYIRKQTIANGERYFTPELKEMETRILTASSRLLEYEWELFVDLRKKVASHAARVQRTAQAVGALDAICALADLALENGFVRPEVHDGIEIDIEQGRHPTLERLIPAGEFIPNDIQLGEDHGSLMLITGPNMSGKSTVMRQVALTVVLAQMGAWVPAAKAKIGLVDRVFTRVGASDSITTGRSTFMVEMVEAAEILHHATDRSLVLLDEIGRGTSTYDGLSIAWAVTEDLHDRIQARTLFATHYHELVHLADTLPGVRNAHIAIREWEGTIIFLRRLRPGPMRRSYGVEVAALAGLPDAVVERARNVLESLESDATDPRSVTGQKPDQPQMDLFSSERVDPRWVKVEAFLESIDPEDTTPRQALDLLYKLRDLL